MPSTGLQKTVEIDDERKLLPFYERSMGQEVSGESLGDEFKGYTFKIMGGNDKQGFPMMQGVLVNHRVRLLFTKGMKCFRPRRTGHKVRKSVRGCIVGPDIAALALVVTKKGDEDIPGLTDADKPCRLGPKRASNIRKLFGLTKADDVRKYVVRREIEGRKIGKAPRIQRLVTPARVARKAAYKRSLDARGERAKTAAADYVKLLKEYKEAKKTIAGSGSPRLAAAASPKLTAQAKPKTVKK